MTTLKYIGTHQPAGMLIDVKEEDIERLLDTGEYELLESKKSNIVPKEDSDDNSKRFKQRV